MFKILLALFLLYAMPGYPFNVDQVKEEIFLELSDNLKGNSKDKPILLLIGGYPGAGKTTLINALTQTHDIAVISWNAIRQALVNRCLKGSPHDFEIIEYVNQNLFKICLDNHLNIAIDANAYTNNIKLFEDLLTLYNCQDTYKVIKICLNPPFETLFNRVRSRQQKEFLHQGTLMDLLRDLQAEHKRMNANDYSLIIKNDETIPFEIELNIVNAFLNPFFAQQKRLSLHPTKGLKGLCPFTPPKD